MRLTRRNALIGLGAVAGGAGVVTIGISIHFQSLVVRNRERRNRAMEANYGFDH